MNQKKVDLKFFCMVFIFIYSFSCYTVHGANLLGQSEIIAKGKTLPQFELIGPSSEQDQQWLGLKNMEPFTLSQIPAKLIVLELFSVYCPHCRSQAPQLNKVYGFIKQDKELSGDIKMIGIAAGADKTKTDKWKTTLHVPFPLVPDETTDIWQIFGKPGIPVTLLINGKGKVLSTHYGVIEDIEAFFKEIKKLYKKQ